MNESRGLLLEKRVNGFAHSDTQARGLHAFPTLCPRRQALILHWYANQGTLTRDKNSTVVKVEHENMKDFFYYFIKCVEKNHGIRSQYN